MPAYISVSDVSGLSPSAASQGSGRDSQIQEVIDSLLLRIDSRTGQYFASGYEGNYDVKKYDWSMDGRTLAVPRMSSVARVERHTGDSWETISEDNYETTLVYPHKWSGIDTILFNADYSYQRVRVNGKVGFGNGDDQANPFVGDEAPADIVLETKKQARYDLSRLPLGGVSGGAIQSGELVVEMDGWLYLMSANITYQKYIDRRTLL